MKCFSAAAIFGSFLALVCLAYGQQREGAAQDNMPATKVMKNIQVFKTMTRGQVMAAMFKFNSSLGVGCDFCHDRAKGMQSDFKRAKTTARDMVRMTIDIDTHQKTVRGGVTCFTCHHGHPEPEKAPPGGEGGPRGRD